MRSISENTQFQRKCIKCKEVFPLTKEFYFNEKSRQYGYSYVCKKCEKERQNERHFKRYYGHYDKEKHRRKQYYHGKGYIMSQIKNYRHQDKKRGWKNDLTVEYFETVFPSKCVYCHSNIKGGLDRIDNNKPHNKENVVPCCSLCNFTRNYHFTYEEMLLLGKTVAVIKSAREAPHVQDDEIYKSKEGT